MQSSLGDEQEFQEHFVLADEYRGGQREVCPAGFGAGLDWRILLSQHS